VGRAREAGDIVAAANENDPVYRALGLGLGTAIGAGSLARKAGNAAVGWSASKIAGALSQVPSAMKIKAETKPTAPPKSTTPSGPSFREKLGNTIATGVAKTIGAASQAPSAIRSAANTVTTGAAKGISKAVGAASQAPSAVKQALDRAKQSIHSKPPEPTKAPKMQMRNMTSSYDHSDLLNALDQLDEATLDAYIDSLTDSEFELLEMMVNESIATDDVEAAEHKASPRPGDQKITKPWNTYGKKNAGVWSIWRKTQQQTTQ
jgi:hypothetical protein